MEKEVVQVQIMDSKGVHSIGEFTLYEESPRHEEMVLIELAYNEKKLSCESDNFFSALVKVRTELEAENLFIACNGAAENVYPSSMQLSMGSGRKAYKLTLGHQPRLVDVVDIFGQEKELTIAGIREQAKYYERWLASLT